MVARPSDAPAGARDAPPASVRPPSCARTACQRRFVRPKGDRCQLFARHAQSSDSECRDQCAIQVSVRGSEMRSPESSPLCPVGAPCRAADPHSPVRSRAVSGQGRPSSSGCSSPRCVAIGLFAALAYAPIALWTGNARLLASASVALWGIALAPLVPTAGAGAEVPAAPLTSRGGGRVAAGALGRWTFRAGRLPGRCCGRCRSASSSRVPDLA